MYIHQQGDYSEVFTQIVLKKNWSQLIVEIFETSIWRASHLQVVNINDIILSWICSKLTIRTQEWHKAVIESYFSKLGSRPATLLKMYLIAGWITEVIVGFFCMFFYVRFLVTLLNVVYINPYNTAQKSPSKFFWKRTGLCS